MAKGSEKSERGAEQSPKVAREAVASEPLGKEIMEEGQRVRGEDRRKTSV
jgi:hypothetical protein